MVNRSRAKHTNGSSVSIVSNAFISQSTFLKKFISRYLQREQDIEDVVQEAFLKAYIAEQRKGEIEHPKAFLYSIAKNLAINELSRKSRQMTDYIDECQAESVQNTGPSLEQEVEGNQSVAQYCEAVAALPEKCRRVYLLRKVHGLTHREISEKLGITRSAVEKHLANGVLGCREYVRRLGERKTR